MTPPTVHEFAGIFMLALATSVLISHSAAGIHSVPPQIQEPVPVNPGFDTIDGIESIALPEQ